MTQILFYLGRLILSDSIRHKLGSLIWHGYCDQPPTLIPALTPLPVPTTHTACFATNDLDTEKVNLKTRLKNMKSCGICKINISHSNNLALWILLLEVFIGQPQRPILVCDNTFFRNILQHDKSKKSFMVTISDITLFATVN